MSYCREDEEAKARLKKLEAEQELKLIAYQKLWRTKTDEEVQKEIRKSCWGKAKERSYFQQEQCHRLFWIQEEREEDLYRKKSTGCLLESRKIACAMIEDMINDERECSIIDKVLGERGFR